MAYDIQFNVRGIEELNRKLDGLSRRMRTDIARASVRSGARVIAAIAKRNAMRIDDKETAEKIYENIGIAVSTPKTSERTGQAKARVGVMGGAVSPKLKTTEIRRKAVAKRIAAGKQRGKKGGDTWYWRLVEFGTRKMAARPFMRPALASGADGAISATAIEMNKQLDKAASELRSSDVR